MPPPGSSATLRAAGGMGMADDYPRPDGRSSPAARSLMPERGCTARRSVCAASKPWCLGPAQGRASRVTMPFAGSLNLLSAHLRLGGRKLR